MSTASKPQRRIGYVRASTDEQTTGQQTDALRRAGCAEIFVDDAVRATARNRPALKEAKAALREGDAFTVWAIDRAFRSTAEAILFLDEIMQSGIEFLSLTQRIDTRTPEGRKWYIDTASWAEYERAIISRRTKEKMDFLRRAGKHVGRPYKLSRRCAMRAYQQFTEDGVDLQAIAIRYRVAPITVRRAFARYGLEG